MKFLALAFLGIFIVVVVVGVINEKHPTNTTASPSAQRYAARKDPHAAALKLVATQGVMLIYAFANPNDTTPPDQIVRQFQFICDETNFPVCAILFWKNAADAPLALPMTDTQINSQYLAYWRNFNTSFEELLKSRENGTDAMDEIPFTKSIP